MDNDRVSNHSLYLLLLELYLVVRNFRTTTIRRDKLEQDSVVRNFRTTTLHGVIKGNIELTRNT